MENELVKICGVLFQSLQHTIGWVRNKLPSFSYIVFQDTVILVEMIGSTNRFDDDF